MKFSFITIFENLVRPYFGDSILARAIAKNLIEINFISPREFANNKYQKTDDYMVGGGAGLLMDAVSLSGAIKKAQNSEIKPHFIYLTPAGKRFDNNDAKRLAKMPHVCFVCGRYEGIDERIVEKYIDEVFCIGDFVMTGGELGALCMCDAISRQIKGVLGNENSLDEESFENGLLEGPSFTKPNIFENLAVPSDFLKGNHAKIRFLKNKMANAKTQFFRPDLYMNSPE